MILTHPQFDPVAIHITSGFGIHWYGMMYLIGFLAFFSLGRYQIKHKKWFGWTNEMLDDALFYGALGVILGGRLGYILFYKLTEYLHNPLDIFKLWQGGMSFHGGFLGVLVAMYFFNKKYHLKWLSVMDFVAPLVPLGLAAGRMGNFINGELWGRPVAGGINAHWGMVFPQVDFIARHPSQLYEFVLEGLVLFAILWWFSHKQRNVGAISALFLIGYGSFRFLVEFTREPDSYLGLLQLGLSMGQWLSLPMVLLGAWMLWASSHRKFN